MRYLLLLPLLIATPTAAPAQNAPRTVEVRLSSFDYDPREIRLRAGEPVVLRLVNSSGGGHNFSAPAFFAAARIDPGQQAMIREGTIEVRARQSVSVRLVPARGSFRLRCTHTLHSALGMRGRIIVE
ncbi:MAG TPA: cupredoxin domain-containing protein [Allosphingosinicella sp.]|nr:cupredoxin domain-containing protein [Allosphingosinicella sp.]